MLGFYKDLMDKGLGTRTSSRTPRAATSPSPPLPPGKIGILLEGDYFWRSVINPDKGDAPMTTRDSDVGYALIPAKTRARASGARTSSPCPAAGAIPQPQHEVPQAGVGAAGLHELADAIKAMLGGSAKITARQDVNTEVLSKDPLLRFDLEKLLPLTAYRPGLAVYPQVSQALQQATADVVAGKSVADASKAYGAAVQKLAGGADKVVRLVTAVACVRPTPQGSDAPGRSPSSPPASC